DLTPQDWVRPHLPRWTWGGVGLGPHFRTVVRVIRRFPLLHWFPAWVPFPQLPDAQPVEQDGHRQHGHGEAESGRNRGLRRRRLKYVHHRGEWVEPGHCHRWIRFGRESDDRARTLND